MALKTPILCSIAVIAAAFAPSISEAQTERKTLTPAQQAFVNSAPHHKLAYARMKPMTDAMFPKCSAKAELKLVVQTKEIAVDDRNAATAGVWKETYTVTGCGPAPDLNIYWLVDGGGRLQSYAGLPGQTVAGIVQQTPFTADVLAAAAEKAPKCKKPFIADTRFGHLTPAPPSDPPTPRRRFIIDETWVVSSCGKLLDVPVRLESGGENANNFTFSHEDAVEHTAP